MKLIIDIDDNVFTRLFDNGVDTSSDDRAVIDRAVRKGMPYAESPQGDLISRGALKKAITDRLVSVTYNSDYTDGLQEGYLNTINEIDNAPAVSLQDIYQEGHYDGHIEGYTKAINEERPQGDSISRSVLKEEIVKLCERINANNGITVPTLAFTRIINDAPTVEQYISPEVLNQFAKYVAEHERPKGEWINIHDTEYNLDDFKCSVCGEEYPHDYNFCPNCGVQMKHD